VNYTDDRLHYPAAKAPKTLAPSDISSDIKPASAETAGRRMQANEKSILS
jgi:hypothetical protein